MMWPTRKFHHTMTASNAVRTARARVAPGAFGTRQKYQ